MYNPSRGGRAPDDLKNALLIGIESTQGFEEAMVDDLVYVNAKTARKWTAMSKHERAIWLTGQLWNCSDWMSGTWYRMLDLPDGNKGTYGSVSRFIREQLRD